MKKTLTLFVLLTIVLQLSMAIDESKFYLPVDLKSMDLHQDTSTWSFARARESKHFIAFWAKEYGQVDPKDFPDKDYRVDVDTLLAKAEEYYELNVEKLKFVHPGQSKTDRYKMQIFILYQKGIVASGAGWDDTIGALWVNPFVCQPAGAILAHEIGHCFQYQVFCDLGGKAGWRYGFGGNGGNGFWEMTAQWQSFQLHPEQVFSNYYYRGYLREYQFSTFHEEQRYSNYFLEFYWAQKHGVDIIAKMWRNSGSKGEEDPAQAYMRLTGINLKQYNREQFDYAQHMATWDLDALRPYGQEHIGDLKTELTEVEDGFWQVTAKSCPQNHGYNVIRLKVPQNAKRIRCEFTGLAGVPGYRSVQVDAAGWHYGFVALQKNGTRVYGRMAVNPKGSCEFNCPAECSDLFFVVLGAPTRYWMHAWDDQADNDEQWPYKVRFTGTEPTI